MGVGIVQPECLRFNVKVFLGIIDLKLFKVRIAIEKLLMVRDAVILDPSVGTNKTVRRVSVFDLEKERFGEFDIVYSWGVLHHTGDMNRAIETAAKRVKPGGLFAVALYGKTRYCEVWKRIKRWYVNASATEQARAERIYIRLFGFYLLLRGKRLSKHIAGYKHKRGMDFLHDVRDWIGGYPYESIAPRELARLLTPLGFDLIRQNVRKRSGLFGSGNDEYLFRRHDADSNSRHP